MKNKVLLIFLISSTVRPFFQPLQRKASECLIFVVMNRSRTVLTSLFKVRISC
uniref:Uncharacterized protein n=1 Tax=Klebsiella pneumoniae TaxID=573 RepID=A0A8B0SSE6_KLEPN|nr:hypothetical protein [Klebsiella pneumoniae]